MKQKATPECESNTLSLGFPKYPGYQGAFCTGPHKVITTILADTPEEDILHLYSGSSEIGGTRVDYAHTNATHRQDVIEFIETNRRVWKFVLLDPPYDMVRTTTIADYARKVSLCADVSLRRAFEDWSARHAVNILWLDMCAPIFTPFIRYQMWLFLPGGYRKVRVLSWLQNAHLMNG